jgi:DUF1365 family protein
MESALYFGALRHRRFRPVAHEFRYGLFMAFLDIDRIPETMAQSRFASYNRFNWASFYEADHFGDPKLPLRERLKRDAAAHGIELPAGQIFLLTHLRYLGYNFNPISLFYCFDQQGRLPVILAEVNSTFGETRNYWLSKANRTASNGTDETGTQRFRCAKDMHVSPFMAMEHDYDFVLTPPTERLVAHMNVLDDPANGRFFDATLTLDRRPWRDLARGLLRFPWMTAKVVFAIHWQALRLYLKGAPVFTHPAKLDARRETITKHS